MYKRNICLILYLLIITSLFYGCNKSNNNQNKQLENITLVLDWTPNTNHTGIYVAKDLGYYEAEGINLNIIQPPEGGALSLVAAEKAEFAVSFQEEVLVAANADTPLPIIAFASIIEHNTSGILSLKEKNIERFKDMEGKSYGSWETPIYDSIVKECIKIDGGNPDKVDFIPNSATNSLSGIQRDFDSVWVYEGWDKVIADIKGIKTNFIMFKDINPIFDYYTPVLVTNNKIANYNPNLLNKFMRATAKGYSLAKEDPSQAADILLKYAPEMDKNLIHASQEVISELYFSNKWGYIDPARWNGFFAWMKDNELLNRKSNNEAFKNIEY